MLLLVLSVSLFILSAASSLPLDQNEERYLQYSDEYGKLHKIDLWDNTPLPSSIEPEEQLGYYLFTRKNPTQYQQLKKGDVQGLKNSNFDPSKPVKFTIHGWTVNFTSSSDRLIRDAYLATQDVNVISIDWSIGAALGWFKAVQYVQKSGPIVAEFVDWLNEQGASFNTMHMVGHSLGAQMSGLIGRSCKRGQLEYITGTDPAGPSHGANSQRIRKADAKYVELIHTNSGGLGMKDAVGHNDFYPNGGIEMPGCDDPYCHHNKAFEYLAESILHGGFEGVQCNSVAEAIDKNCTGTERLHMGGANIKPALGIFALKTNAGYPYSL